MPEKKDFLDGAFELLIFEFVNAPDSQLSEDLKDECRNFCPREKSCREVYDFMEYLSQKPLTEISPFIQAVCGVSKYYVRPEE